jgi:hypothetical protein
MDVARSVVEWYRVWFAIAGGLLAACWTLLPKGARRPALAGLAVLALANYVRWGPEAIVKRLDAYDLLHYYVNAKYMDELGYLDLYPAVLLVDAENGGPFFPKAQQYMAQDERGHHFEPISHGVARGRVVRETRFTPERWATFEKDVLTLQRDIGCRDRDRRGRCVRELDDTLWRDLVLDHGFNGTPVWSLVAGPIANAVPVEHLKALASLDVGVLAVALGVVAWACGADAALFALLFLLLTYSTRWPYVGWVFLRYDWVAALLVATALLRRPGGRWGALLAGLAAGWAATLRFFPALWMWGPLARGLWGLWERELRRPLLVLAGGFLLAVGVLQGAATARFGAPRVAEHFENMLDHNSAEQLSSRRVGLATALATQPWRGLALEKNISNDTRARIGRQSGLRYALGGALTLALGFALRRRDDDEAFAWGFLPFFLMTTASYYYYVSRAPLILIHATRLDRARHRVGLASLLALEAGSSALEVWAPGHRMLLVGSLAWGLLAYGVSQMVWMVVEDRRAALAG